MYREDYYRNLLNKWERTGYIGRCFCNTRDKAERMAYIIAKVKEPERENKPPKYKIEPTVLPQKIEQLRLF